MELGFGDWVGFLWAEMWRKKTFQGKGPLTHKARASGEMMEYNLRVVRNPPT